MAELRPVRYLIISAVATIGNAAPAQVRFREGVSMVRCKTKNSVAAGLDHEA
jgi:hypothetical protein